MKRSQFLADLFYFARDKKFDIALARPFLADIIQSDIDLLIEQKNVDLIDQFIQQQKSLKKIGSFSRTDGKTFYIYGIENGQAMAIHIDLITDLSYRGNAYLDIRHVLQRSFPGDDGIILLNDIDQAIILLMIHGIKHKGSIKQTYIDAIQTCLKRNTVAFPDTLVRLFGTRAAIDLLEGLAIKELPLHLWRRLSRAYLLQRWCERGVPSVVSTALYFLKRILTTISISPVNIVILGVDGAGKTTLIHYLKKTLNQSATMIRQPHFMPAWPWKREDDSSVTLHDPHAKPLRDAFTSYLKLGYILFRYWLVYLWPHHGTSIYLYDRSMSDMLVDPKRYRYGGSINLLRSACRLAPPIQASILIEVDAQTAQNRKKEVSATETKRQVDAYRQLITTLPNPIILKGDMPMDRMTAIATGHIIQSMHRHAVS